MAFGLTQLPKMLGIGIVETNRHRFEGGVFRPGGVGAGGIAGGRRIGGHANADLPIRAGDLPDGTQPNPGPNPVVALILRIIGQVAHLVAEPQIAGQLQSLDIVAERQCRELLHRTLVRLGDADRVQFDLLLVQLVLLGLDHLAQLVDLGLQIGGGRSLLGECTRAESGGDDDGKPFVHVCGSPCLGFGMLFLCVLCSGNQLHANQDKERLLASG